MFMSGSVLAYFQKYFTDLFLIMINAYTADYLYPVIEQIYRFSPNEESKRISSIVEIGLNTYLVDKML